MAAASSLELHFLRHWAHAFPELPPQRNLVLPRFAEWHREHRRRGSPMNVDFAWPDARVALEIQGGTWARGNSGHSSGTGIRRDITKAFLAQSSGWLLLQLDSTMLKRESTCWFPMLAATIRSRLTLPAPVQP